MVYPAATAIVPEIYNVLHLDRSQSFYPQEFLGDGWSIDEECEQALTFTEIDVSKIRLEINLHPKENYIIGEERLKRLKISGVIRLDALVFQMFWENQYLIPESWKQETDGDRTYILFDGSILRGTNGNRCVLWLCWDDGKWYWSFNLLRDGFGRDQPSAVLVSSSL